MKSIFSFLKKTLLYPTILLLSVAPLSPAHAQAKFSGPCVGPSYTGNSAADVATIQGFECLVANILASAITLIGIVAFVMFLVGGFAYLTAGPDAKKVESGKNAITFAIIGIVVALGSFLILNVIAQLTGVKTILQFGTQLR